MAYSVITTPVSGTTISTTDFGIKVKDNFDAAFPLGVDGWTSYTPTLTQSATVTKTVNYAKYQRVGRLIVAEVFLTCTGAGTANNIVEIGLPVTAAFATSLLPVGTFFLFDNGVANYHAAAVLGSTSVVRGIANGDGQFMGVTGADFAAALASGDTVAMAIIYEAAS